MTDANGKSLGTALDLVVGIERVAGQYYGRQGDEQFRVYCQLKPGAREILEKSREFKFTEENIVYHVGYPYSYRQEGKVPNMQFSISEDGLRADIDVDYRSSKVPAAMWNGHLTSANSDVRAGDNYKRHNDRWAGLVNWWSAILGKMPEESEASEEQASCWPKRRRNPPLLCRRTVLLARRSLKCGTRLRNCSPTGWSGVMTKRWGSFQIRLWPAQNWTMEPTRAR